jgi:uncharacterized protein YraI
MNSRWYYFPLFILLVLILSFAIVVRAGQTSTDTYLQIQVAPSGAQVAIDGHSAGSGKYEINPGEHTITVSRQGFATQTSGANVRAGQTAYFGAILEPNSSATQDWYNKHSSDQQLSQVIADRGSDYNSASNTQANPFLAQLPLSYGDGNGGQITIAPGVPLSGSSQPAIYVNATTPAERQGVLTYMRSRGYDPATMDMVFYDTSNPLQISGSE